MFPISERIGALAAKGGGEREKSDRGRKTEPSQWPQQLSVPGQREAELVGEELSLPDVTAEHSECWLH